MYMFPLLQSVCNMEGESQATVTQYFCSQMALVVRRLAGQLLPMLCNVTMTHLQAISWFAVVLFVTCPHSPVRIGKSHQCVLLYI